MAVITLHRGPSRAIKLLEEPSFTEPSPPVKEEDEDAFAWKRRNNDYDTLANTKDWAKN